MALKPRENKVKFGLKRVAFALATIAADGSAVSGDPVSFPGARSLSLEPQGVGEAWHADDGVYYFSSAPESRQGDLEMARYIDAFKRQVLGYVIDANGVDAEDINPAEVHFALLFETMNDKKPRRYVMYNCVATVPIVGSTTNEGSKEVQSETSSITSMGVYVASHDKWVDYAETTPDTDAQAYANWFSAVQLPSPPLDPYPIKTVTGAEIMITDAANMPAVGLTVQMLPIQSGSGTPSPDNVRQISGHTRTLLTVNAVTQTIRYLPDSTPAYGGTLDVINGRLTVDYRVLQSTFGQLATSTGDVPAGYVLKSFRITDPDEYPTDDWLSGTLCNIAVPNASSNAPNVVRFSNNKEFCILTLPEDLDASTPVTVVYPAAVVDMYWISPLTIQMQRGVNTVSADSGDVILTYHSDRELS